jgi:hypothetical protein
MARSRPWDRWCPMMDLLVVALTLAFFLVAWLYVRACERI